MVPREDHGVAGAPQDGSDGPDVEPDRDLAPVTDIFSARRGSGPGQWLPPVTGSAQVRPADRTGDTDSGLAAGGADNPESAGADEDDQADVERISMRALGRRQLSVAEMRSALTRHGVSAEHAEAEVMRLERVGLLDDSSLACELVDRLRRRKGLGRVALVQELRRRAIAQPVIDAAIESDDPADDGDAARAIELATRRASQLRQLDRETAERRLAGYLMRKGYSGSAVRTAVQRALDGNHSSGSAVRFE